MLETSHELRVAPDIPTFESLLRNTLPRSSWLPGPNLAGSGSHVGALSQEAAASWPQPELLALQGTPLLGPLNRALLRQSSLQQFQQQQRSANEAILSLLLHQERRANLQARLPDIRANQHPFNALVQQQPPLLHSDVGRQQPDLTALIQACLEQQSRRNSDALLARLACEPTSPAGARSPPQPMATRAQSALPWVYTPPSRDNAATLPPVDSSSTPPYTNRERCPLGAEEDVNWLSDFHCFLRSEVIEVFRASGDNGPPRHAGVSAMQVGLRCRFCAHQRPSGRTSRSCAFPSSLRQIYQSFSMMIRDHLSTCQCIPVDVQQRFNTLRGTPSQGATDSKRYWIHAAQKIGLRDSTNGITVNEASVVRGRSMPPFAVDGMDSWPDDSLAVQALVAPGFGISSSLYLLISQLQFVRLLEQERLGSRRNLPHGTKGLGCRYCCKCRRIGLSRIFPARRRTLVSKTYDLLEHVMTCPVTPQTVKDQLATTGRGGLDLEHENKQYFDDLWHRIEESE